MTEDEALIDIADDLESACSYRVDRAEAFPEDERNEMAVRSISALRDQVSMLRGSDQLARYQKVSHAYYGAGIPSGTVSRYGARIAFDHSPSDIREYVHNLIFLMESEICAHGATDSGQE